MQGTQRKPTMNEQKTDWENRYQAGKTGWDRGDISPQLQAWLASNSLKPCRILIPGCGNGYEVSALAAAGFEVVALDIAPSPVKQLRKQLLDLNLNAQVLQEDILQWQSEMPFDAIYEQTSLCALPPVSWPQYEQQLYRWLKPGGKCFSLLMQTHKQGGPPHHCALSDMHSLFSSTRWQWSEVINKVPHPAGFYELATILEKI